MNELTHKNCLEGTLDQLGTAGPRIIAALAAGISKQHRGILGGDQREALKGPDQGSPMGGHQRQHSKTAQRCTTNIGAT